MVQFLKKLFGISSKTTEPVEEHPLQGKKYPLGVIDEQPDVRSIPFTAVFTPTQITNEYFKTDLSMFPKWWQLNLGTCVAHAYAFAKMVIDFIETGKVIKYSRRFIYVMTRRFLGYVTTNELSNQGLPANEAAKIIAAVGVPEEDGRDDSTLTHIQYVDSYTIDDTLRKKANTGRARGFTFPDISVDGIKQALNVTKIVPVTIYIDWNKIAPDGTVHAPVRVAGTHEVCIYGWEPKNGGRFIAHNWWSELPDLYINFNELENVVYSAISFSDVPNDLIQRAKEMQYIFLADLKLGSSGTAVSQLQKRLMEYGLLIINAPTGYFGPMTQIAVKEYQKLKNIAQTGNVGTLTRTALNGDVSTTTTKSKLDLWCEIAKKIEGAKTDLNNPGNIRCNAFKHKDATGISKNGFCIFPTYELGYMALRNMFVRACTTGSASYKPTMTLYEFYAVYAPKSDNNNPVVYAETVAKYIGVDPNEQIKNLV